MKLMITMEVDFSDLPEEVRVDMADGLNFRADDDDTAFSAELEPVPRVADYSIDDVTSAITDVLESMEDYDTQQELWAGSDVYGYFSRIRVIAITDIA